MPRIGHRIAQPGGLLMIAGGLLGMSIREVLPHQATLLAGDAGSVPASVPAGSAALVLAEEPNALGIRATGSPLFVAPLAFLLLLVVGCAICPMAASGARPGVIPAR